MRRTITMGLFALFLMLGGLFTAAPAQAACTGVTGGTGVWPYASHVHWCSGTVAADGTNVVGVLKNIVNDDNPSGTTNLEAGYILTNAAGANGTTGAQFYIFGTQSDYANSLNTGYCQTGMNYQEFGYNSASQCKIYPTSFAGVTVISQGFTLIFKASSPSLVNTATHEAGHWLDNSSAYITLLGGSPTYASDTTNFASELNQDWTALNNTANFSACSLTPYGVFRGTKDQFGTGSYICAGTNGAGPGLNPPYSGNNENILKAAWPYFYNRNPSPETATIGGTLTTGDVVSITIIDSGLPGGFQTVSYTVASGNTVSSIVTGLTNSINGNTNLQTALITATAASPTISITSRSRNSTTYSKNVTGSHTETVTLAAPSGSLGPTNAEFFAEVVAVVSGNPAGGSQSADNYLRTNEFNCTRRLIESMMHYGQIPGRPGSVLPWTAGCPAF